MKTYSPKKSDFNRKWYLLDAKGKTLGRMATEVANVLRGKNKPQFAPHVDCGDFVIIINAKEVHLTGNKKENKEYITHSGYPGGINRTPFKRMQAKKPELIVKQAIAGMIPKNRLRKEILMKLKIYPESEHPHEAQKPQPLTLK